MVKLAFLDIDINGSRAAHDLCCEFVKNCNLRYGLSSNDVNELGGGERKALAGFFASDFGDGENPGAALLACSIAIQRDVIPVLCLIPAASSVNSNTHPYRTFPVVGTP